MNALMGLTWPEVPERPLVMVPVGSLEQHGPHLPLDTDTVIAQEVARQLSERAGALVAPPLIYAASGEHQSFPGTVSIGNEALTMLLVELVRSLSAWAGRIVFVNAHGGNAMTLSSAVRQLIDEGHQVAWLPCATEEFDLHAGFTETSLMLFLRPESVGDFETVVGDIRPLEEVLPDLMAGGMSAVTTNGVLGDPRAANAGHGERILSEIVDDAWKRWSSGRVTPQGMLARPDSEMPRAR